ncbi:MAG: hypothetical protein OHK005_16240 [Candidatus Methylacidiphilales bacterium]
MDPRLPVQTPSLVDALGRVHVFAGLDHATLVTLAERASVARVETSGWIAQEGEMSSSFFCLLTGRVSVVRAGVCLAELKAGECFGEMSMLECKPRSAGVRALEPCTVASLRSTDLLAIYENQPAQYAIIILNLARDLARRLHQLDERFAATHA